MLIPSVTLHLNHSPWISASLFKHSVSDCPFIGGYNFKKMNLLNRDHKIIDLKYVHFVIIFYCEVLSCTWAFDAALHQHFFICCAIVYHSFPKNVTYISWDFCKLFYTSIPWLLSAWFRHISYIVSVGPTCIFLFNINNILAN